MLKQFNSNTKKLNRVIQKVNTNNLTNTDLTGSLLNIEIPTNTKFESNTKTNPNPIKLVNNKTKIAEFYSEILEFSGRSLKRGVDLFDNTGFGSLTIQNVALDYGTEGASSENFEVLVYGLHIPGDYSIQEIGNDVVVTLNNDYIFLLFHINYKDVCSFEYILNIFELNCLFLTPYYNLYIY